MGWGEKVQVRGILLRKPRVGQNWDQESIAGDRVGREMGMGGRELSYYYERQVLWFYLSTK